MLSVVECYFWQKLLSLEHRMRVCQQEQQWCRSPIRITSEIVTAGLLQLWKTRQCGNTSKDLCSTIWKVDVQIILGLVEPYVHLG